MMIYEFSCVLCGHTVDKDYKILERPTHILTTCEGCGELTELVYQISAPSVSFKGIGWAGEDLKKRK